MNTRTVLEKLRIDLKNKIDAIIDEAILQTEVNYNQLVKCVEVNRSSVHVEETQNKSNNFSQDIKIRQIQESDSPVLNYPFIQLSSLSQSQESITSSQNEISLDRNEDSIRLQLPAPTTPLKQNKTFMSMENSNHMMSPVLTETTRCNIKRNEPVSVDDLNQNQIDKTLFEKSFSCITPVKANKIRSIRKKVIPAIKLNETPPHFWSLDMPSSSDN